MSGSAEKKMVLMLERLVDHLLVRGFLESEQSGACDVKDISIDITDDLIRANKDGLSIPETGKLHFIETLNGNVRYKYSRHESVDLSDEIKKVRIPDRTRFKLLYKGMYDQKKLFALEGAGLLILFPKKN